MELVGAIIEIMKCFGGPICRCIDYHRKLEKNVHHLRSKMDDLNIRRQDIESRKEVEIRCGKVVKREVEKWLEEAERVNIEMQNIDHKFSNVPYFSRSPLGKLVRQKIKEVERIYKQGRFTEGVAVEGPLTVGLTLPTTNLEGEIDVKEQIWKYLMNDDDVGMIGVCGMGGIGKTTIMKHINNQLVKENQFDQVIWVTVSKELSIFNLQEDIARAMKIEHDFPTKVLERAAILKKTLEQKRYVLILDDVWERFPLLEVGIIEATLGKERKVVFTSRSIEVCISMGCNVVKVQPLSKRESMNLFLDHVGRNVRKNRGLEDIVEKIVEQCSGLPLAIATIGRSMKGEDDISEWRNALKELQDRLKSVKGSDKYIFEQLKFSYDRLKDYPNIQNCFLYCSLYPEDYAIEKVELIESWIDEGLIDLETRQAMHDRGHSTLNKLVNNCLLERVWTEDFEKIKMHDVLRDLALTIKSSDHFMVKAGTQFIELPEKHEWKMSLEKVSFINNSKLELPPHLSPKCPHLTTLLFQGCGKLNNLSESFFMHVPALKVLNLSHTAITHLPNSISFLKNLRALILVCCERLRFVPSLAELRALRKLDLLDSNIQEVPQGIEMLEKLTYLRLGSWYLKELPVGIISPRISHLQYLIARDIHLWGEEVGRLRKLEVLACKFCDVQEYKNYARLIQGKFPTNFYILVGSSIGRYYSWGESSSMLNFKSPWKHLVFRKCEMEKIDDMTAPNCVVTFLNIDECDDLKCLNKSPLLHKAKELKNCSVSDCEGVECVVDLSLSSCSYSGIQGIEKLILYRLGNLGELVRVYQSPKQPASTIFMSLRELSLFRCQTIETLFPAELLQGLHSLESIEVKTCEKMERIFGEVNIKKGDEGTACKLNLPKLRSLTLCALPRLKSICSVGIMIPAHLQFLHIADCPQLKRIPLCLPMSENRQPSLPPCLKLFKVWPREWWESVELEDPSPFAKDVLSRFLIYQNEAPSHVLCLHHSYRFPEVIQGSFMEAACSNKTSQPHEDLPMSPLLVNISLNV